MPTKRRTGTGTAPRLGAIPFAEKLDRTIDRAVGHLFDLQYDDGYWWGELEANCAIHAEYLLLTHFMDLPDRERWRKIANYLKQMQLEDGGWPIWYGGPSDLSIAVECYFAMKLAGEPYDDPALVKAREFILSKGGVPETPGLHQDVACPLRPVGVGGHAGAACRDHASPGMVPAEHLRIRQLGAGHHRGPAPS